MSYVFMRDHLAAGLGKFAVIKKFDHFNTK
jgi:hypothetical protein